MCDVPGLLLLLPLPVPMFDEWWAMELARGFFPPAMLLLDPFLPPWLPFIGSKHSETKVMIHH